MHVLPRVRELEERFGDALSVVGVHAGKYSTERHTDRIAEACDRLGVVHAVVNDRQYRIWRDYAVQAWPTVALIDPAGYVVGVQSGEFPLEPMAEAIQRVIDRAESEGTIRRGPDPAEATLARHEGPLRFPTRAIVDGGTLWVSDTGHGRVLECDWNPASRSAAVRAEHRGFTEPRGLAAHGDALWVADRGGHTLWRITDGEARVVAGTGVLGGYAGKGGSAAQTELRSPWGVAQLGDRLAIAMAGSHQLWTLDADAGRIEPLAGTGHEDILDGPFGTSMLAQPTGIATFATGLAVAECESSAVRIADTNAGEMRTLVGTGLFDFGDRNGVGDEALLQHNEDVAAHGTVLAVADTYNDRLKLVDPLSRAAGPWLGEAGAAGALREPGGVWSDGSTLLVADTGHHRIVVVEGDGALTEVRIS